MANPSKSWEVQYAVSSRSKCKTCNKTIGKNVLRIGKIVHAPHFDGYMPIWKHATCILDKPRQFQVLHEVKGVDALRWKDQQKIIEYVGGLGQGLTLGSGGSTLSNEYTIQNAESSRAKCKCCNEVIVRGEVRISTMPEADQPKNRGNVAGWSHAKCFLDKGLWTRPMEKMHGWDSLSDEHKQSVLSIAKPCIQESKEEHCRKRGSKKRKADEYEARELEQKLQKQTDALWKINDELEKHFEIKELREMLQENDQNPSGQRPVLRARCADGMLFGALGKCPICEGTLEYFDRQYVCQGHISPWSKCTFSITNPERLKGEWEIPSYLSERFTSPKEKKLARIFRPQSTKQPSENLDTFLTGLTVAIVGDLKERRVAWKKKLKAAGGKVLKTVTQDAYCLVIDKSKIETCKSQINNKSEIGTYKAEIENAVRMNVPLVGESFLVDCLEKKLVDSLERKEKLLEAYKIKETEEPLKSALDNVKHRVRDSVHVSSGKQATGRILAEGKSFYSITLNMCDLSSNINSYYILQVIEDNNGVYYLFRKWDRVGSDQPVRQLLQKKSKAVAIGEFKKLFRKYSGNDWENWVKNKGNFEKKSDKYYPLDLDYRSDGQEDISRWSDQTKLDPLVLDLMKILFDPNTYRDKMMEFDIRMPIMPLGKLTESHILNGMKALKHVEDIIKLNEPNDRVKESKLVDASSRFFTLIPTVNPRVIQDKEDFKSKNDMLEDLRQMEIASKRMLDKMRFDIKDGDPFYSNYERLKCPIYPLPQESSDYRLIKKYLERTLAPEHKKKWEIELENVYTIDREGELDAYKPRKNKLKNCMLLWHGSRVTNFIGILMDGLRIAPREAPKSGYKFGKGIYLADLGSKSATYCNVSEKNPVGLMLLSEGALGEVYEIEKEEYMEEAPKGKHSTKAVGMSKYSTEYEHWRGDVVVPCGGLVSEVLNIEKDHVPYNEYIVYKPDQVKLQFLLKVRFHFKHAPKEAGNSN